MKVRIQKIDDEFAVVVPNELLLALQIGDETPLSAEVRDGRLIITPERELDRQARFEAALESSIQRYGDVYQRLAEGPG